jgi:hypothetical protein
MSPRTTRRLRRPAPAAAERALRPAQVPAAVRAAIAALPVVDIHTHLFDPAMGPLVLWGIDELLTYHYLVAEVHRARPDLRPAQFWALGKTQQADLIWDELFVRRSPVSEACRGVLTVLHRLGLEPAPGRLPAIRAWFARQDMRAYTDLVLRLARVRQLYMTNDPLDPVEQPLWQRGFERDPRFRAVLRLDSALVNWPAPVPRLAALGYAVDDGLTGRTIAGLRRYLADWVRRMDARYMAISLTDQFRYPNLDSPLSDLLGKAVIPTARELGLPVALMIGVRRQVNPALRLAGDSVGRCDVSSLERLATEFPDVRFLVTLLARENQHELCVTARKYSNLLPFGCWWFLNNPSLIAELTRLRTELLGLSYVPQHSDCRVLDQLLYKWEHSRPVIADALAAKYADLAGTGWPLTRAQIERDAHRLLDVEF